MAAFSLNENGVMAMFIEELSDEVIAFGVKEQMQDMYLYLQEEKGVIQFRKNQQIASFKEISPDIAQQLITRFKYLGEMDVGEHRRAQLGAITYPLNEDRQRLRLSTVGDYRGNESLVVRFLYNLSLDHLHYFSYEQFETIIKRTQEAGLYLFSGPTGSGKTTLMYQLAKQMKGQVITIEDPVEIEEPTFLQLQTNDKINQTYDQLIKLSLRHRPDILIIGEIRDEKTAKAAIRAALTGHKVFATIHAKGVRETRSRMIDLIGETSELDNCLQGVIYQKMLSDSSGQPEVVFGYEFYEEPSIYLPFSESLKQYQRYYDGNKEG